MNGLTESLALAAAVGCALFGAHLLTVRSAVRIPTRLLGVNFVAYAVQAALLAAHLEGWLPPGLAPLRPIFAMTLGPLIFLYFESAADPGFRARSVDLLHFLPAAVIGAELASGTFWLDVDVAISASFGGYAAALWFRAWTGAGRFRHLGAGSDKAFRMMLVAAAALAVSSASEIAISVDVVRGLPLRGSPALLTTLLAELMLIGFAILAALSRPSPFDWMYETGADAAALARARTFASTPEERAIHAAAFDRLIETDRVWLEEGVTLAAVADRIGIPARRLSEAINSVHGESFSRRLNRLRVEEAKRLLRDDPELPVIAAMLDAGFRTKSSFNREFKALTGLSPTDYRARSL